MWCGANNEALESEPDWSRFPAKLRVWWLYSNFAVLKSRFYRSARASQLFG